MKNLAIIVFVLLIVTVLASYLISFQVRETESALVTTFGKPAAQIVEPGWYFKWPAPIQRVYKFDSRFRVFDGDLVETTTRGAMPIIVNTFVVWRIAEPLQFFNAVGTVKELENKLRSLIGDTENKVIGRHDFSEFINSDPAKIKFEQIQDEMLTELQASVKGIYGVEVRQLGIKQLKINEDVSKDVFARMTAERDRRTESIISEGNAEAAKISDDAETKRTILLAAAEARAKAIRGKGDAEAAKYYKMLDADPELAMFLRNIEALKKILAKRSTIVFSADTEPFKLLKEMPSLQPKK